MPRPTVFLIFLLAGGAAAGWWILRRDSTVVREMSRPALLRVQREVEAAGANPSPVMGVPGAAPVPVAQAVDGPPDFAGIAVELVQVRELHLLPQPPTVVAREEVAQRIGRWLTQQFPGDVGIREGRALAALGLIPEPVDTTALRATFWSHQLGAWYDAKEEMLALAERPEGDDQRENALGLAFAQIFREYGDQLFPSDGKQVGTDVWMARFGLIAGDAAFTRLRHALVHPRTGGGGGVGEDPDDPSHEFRMPAYLRERDLAAFGVGMDFVSSLHGLGKFDQVTAAYGRPPVASIELLEPSLYLAGEQFKSAASGWTELTVGGVEPFWDDTLGAIGLVLLLKQYLPQPIAAEAVPGWRGDRWLAYPARSGSRDHAAWETMWQDSNAADAFFSAMRQSLVGRYKAGRVDLGAPHGVFKIDGPDRYVVLTRTRSGRGVFLADAAEPEFLAGLWRKFAPTTQVK